MNIWQIFGKVTCVYHLLKISISVLDGIGTTLIAFFSIADIIKRSFTNEKCIRDYFKKLRKIDSFLGIKINNYFVDGICRYKFAIVTMHIVIFSTFVCDLYSNGLFYGWDVHKYNAVNFILKYKITWFVVDLYMTANTVTKRFELLNKKFSTIIKFQNEHFLEVHAINYMKCHDMLCDLITNINKTYGIQILILEKIIALNVVETTYLCLLLAIQDRTKFNAVIFVNNFIWSIDFIICGALICFSCGKASRVGQHMLVLCQNLYNTNQKNTVKAEILIQFSKQVAEIKPEFSSLEFFPVNY
ncbi:7tm 7 domain containing protein, partial [Asbolus verrucosus]